MNFFSPPRFTCLLDEDWTLQTSAAIGRSGRFTLLGAPREICLVSAESTGKMLPMISTPSLKVIIGRDASASALMEV